MDATAALRCRGDHRRPCDPCGISIGTLEGATVTTIEGLSASGTLSCAAGVARRAGDLCGYCEPGFIMAIAALLDAVHRPRRTDRRPPQHLQVQLSADPRGNRARRAGISNPARSPICKAEHTLPKQLSRRSLAKRSATIRELRKSLPMRKILVSILRRFRSGVVGGCAGS
jgi:aerobic-type carbon monoxide dehydrogenase small subunit (CoxS/CutS family)